MNEEELQLLRGKINAIDAQLVALLNQRASLAIDIGKTKGTNPIYDPIRESEILDNINMLSHGPLPKGSLEDIYSTIISACREIQVQ